MSKQEKHDQNHSRFQEIVDGIRAAESDSDGMKTEYESKVGELLKKGKEKVVEMREAYDRKAEESKNRILASGREDIESEVKSTVAEAKKQSSSQKEKSLSKKDLEIVFDKFVSSL